MQKGVFLKQEALTPERLEYIRRLNDIASERKETLAEMALAWILHQQGVTSVLCGASSPEQLAKDLKCINAAPFLEEDL